MEEDLTRLNPMAHWMLPKDDIGLLTVNRLKKELASARLPVVGARARPATVRAKSNAGVGFANAVSS